VIDLGPFPHADGYAEALGHDANDLLAGFRDRFVRTDADLLYLDGNSLGPMPVDAQRLIDGVMQDQWGDRLIRSWGDGWWDLQLELGDSLAPLVGAGPGEVIISDSTSVNLFKLAVAALKARPGRSKIVTDDLNFPTDIYILDGAIDLLGRGHQLVTVASNGVDGPLDDLAAAIDEDTALVTLSHTVFKSGYTYEMAEVTRLAHDAGALVLWDCSHSVGSVPIDFTGAGVDLAVGCTYKYLNGGPGGPAFLFVRSELQDELTNPITAWWGHREPFAFDLDFAPTAGIRRFHTGTMPILSLAATRAGIELVAEAGMDRIRAKSKAMTEFFIDRWRSRLAPLGFGLASPTDPDRRGSHVSLSHRDAWQINRALIDDAAVLPDFREPNNLRLGLSPLTLSFTEVHTAVERIGSVVEAGVHLRHSDRRNEVT
jgi:kynureninase